MSWKLNRVDDVEHTQDKSGVYVLINWICKDCRTCNKACADCDNDVVRLDVMEKPDADADAESLQSFVGKADNVRKHTMQWFSARISQKAGLGISIEHASYIGAELERADTERIDYVQG